jgi:hypothetical protein
MKQKKLEEESKGRACAAFKCVAGGGREMQYAHTCTTVFLMALASVRAGVVGAGVCVCAVCVQCVCVFVVEPDKKL